MCPNKKHTILDTRYSNEFIIPRCAGGIPGDVRRPGICAEPPSDYAKIGGKMGLVTRDPARVAGWHARLGTFIAGR